VIVDGLVMNDLEARLAELLASQGGIRVDVSCPAGARCPLERISTFISRA